MATFTGPFAGPTVVPVDPALGRIIFGIPGFIDIAANPVAADIYQLAWVPAGFTVTGGFMYLDDIDTNASETIDIDMGWAANGGSGTYDTLDADGLGNFGVMNGDAFAAPSISSSVGNVVPFSGILADGIFPFFTKKTLIQATCVATAATFAAGRLSVEIRGYVDPLRIVG
jgi:hypothetical protein